MSEPSVSEFLQNIGSSRLLTDAQFALLQKQMNGNSLTAEGLAQVLVRQKHLTEWQAKQLLKGQSGFVLKQYQLLNPIGRGGMGHVFRALNTANGDIVAVKVMARKLTSNAKLVSRFRREIRASSQLNCPYIVRALDAGKVGKVDFMVMEYVNGDQVDRIANRLKRVPVSLACELIRQVAEGLQHAHERKMVHRDIKPGNLMIHWDADGNGTTKLMDMGLVLVLSETGDEQTVTKAGQVMGTPDYMSPEQGWDTTSVDIRSDIYSLGCTLFRLLTGNIPFTGSNPLQVLSQRLQRDAPSVLNLCDDIPPQVADVVARMTRRNPEERFQTPDEVASALQPFSEPLTRTAFQVAARTVTNDPDAAISEPQSVEVDDSDGTYQKFLTEVERGSFVDLMLATDTNVNASVATMPVLDVDIDINSEFSSDTLRKTGKPRRGQKLAWVVMGALALVVASAAFHQMTSGDRSDVTTPSKTPPPVSVAEPVGKILDAETETARAGENWTLQLDTSVENVEGNVQIEVGETAPLGVEIDGQSAMLSWNVPETQSAGTYTIPLKLTYRKGDVTQLLDETGISVRVEAGRPSFRFSEFRPQEIAVGEAFETSVVPESSKSVESQIRYRILGPAPSGFKLDELSGVVQWRPEADAMGRHAVRVAMFEKDVAEALDQSELLFVVLPSTIEHVLPNIARQTAAAGEKLELTLPPPELARRPRIQGRRVIETAEGAPAGVEISADGQKLLWAIPNDVQGLVSIPLKASLELSRNRGRRELSGTAILEVNVAAQVSFPQNTLPARDDIEAALSELKETYKQRLLAARTNPQKVILAGQLMEIVYTQSPGASDAALMELVETDLASKARMLDVLMELNALRSQRYATDELAATEAVVPLFRRTTLSPLQQDIVVEHALRLALNAVTSDNMVLADSLLQMVSTLLKNAANGGASAQLVADITAANKLSKELAGESGSAVDEIRKKELQRLLNRWQFQNLFSTASSRNFFTIATNGTPALDGQQYWKISDNRAQLDGETVSAVLGFLESRADRKRFVLRMDVGAETTSLLAVIGATGTDQSNFSALAVSLDASGLGRVFDIRTRTAIAAPTANLRLFTDQVNRMEVVVDGVAVMVRINGTIVTQTQVPAIADGRLGFATNLAVQGPKVRLRNVRVLTLPDSL